MKRQMPSSDAKEVADETIRKFHKFGKENISAAEMEKERERIRKKVNDTAAASSLKSKKPKKNISLPTLNWENLSRF